MFNVVVDGYNAGYMCLKAWPMFDRWKDIFGKDQATDSVKLDLQELYHDMRPNLNVGNESREIEFEASADGHSGTNPVNSMGT